MSAHTDVFEEEVGLCGLQVLTVCSFSPSPVTLASTFTKSLMLEAVLSLYGQAQNGACEVPGACIQKENWKSERDGEERRQKGMVLGLNLILFLQNSV